jgi:hypothetical protein
MILLLTNVCVKYGSRGEIQIEKDAKIELKLDVFDIYRLDISCDYIVRDLSSKINTRFRNSQKKCSLSSLNSNVDYYLENSLFPSKDNQTYQRILQLNESQESAFIEGSLNKYILNANLLQLGGYYEPILRPNSPCSLGSIDFIIFIVPYMNRHDNLNILLVNLHNYLTLSIKLKFKYQILVGEQLNNSSKFNKGQIINTLVKYALDTYTSIDCIVLHDVDIVPLENVTIDYRCRQMPYHLTRKLFILKQNEERVYNQFVTGGVLSLRPAHFLISNGFSNEYDGWGGEDDDWTLRMFNKKLCILRPTSLTALFSMLSHNKSKENSNRFKKLTKTLVNQANDGLSTINKKTKIKLIRKYSLFTHLKIRVNELEHI